MSFKHKHLLGIEQLSAEDILQILDQAQQFKDIINRPVRKVPTLRDFTIANLFFENSTRTKLSFELAQKRLSADVVNFASANSSVKKGETLLDTVHNILAMKVDMVVIRHSSPGVPIFLSKRIDAHIVNAGDGTHEHPTQALLDAFSIREKFNSFKGLRVAIVGDIMHSRVALSNIFCLKKLGAEVQLCGPASFIPKYIHELGVSISHDIDQTLAWCDVANVLRIQLERAEASYIPSLTEYSEFYGITEERVAKANKPILFLHPGPINRGVEITSSVADSSQAMILDQVENGVAIRMAVTYLLFSQQMQRG
jgi:aspartate carbamoyltransferase catalytic subunit